MDNVQSSMNAQLSMIKVKNDLSIAMILDPSVYCTKSEGNL